MTVTRRILLSAIPMLAVLGPRWALAAQPIIYRDAGCGCCHKWSLAMADAGLEVALTDAEDMTAIHGKLGVPESLRGCHAGMIGGYVIEGHVPPNDILRLLQERPAARRLGCRWHAAGIGGHGNRYARPVRSFAIPG